MYEAVEPSLWRSPWVVHCQPVGKGQAALKYLATYRLRESLEWSAGDTITPTSEQVDAPRSESPPAKPSTCRHCGRSMFAVGTIPRFRPGAGWANAPPDHGRSARQYQSKQTVNPLWS